MTTLTTSTHIMRIIQLFLIFSITLLRLDTTTCPTSRPKPEFPSSSLKSESVTLHSTLPRLQFHHRLRTPLDGTNLLKLLPLGPLLKQAYRFHHLRLRKRYPASVQTRLLANLLRAATTAIQPRLNAMSAGLLSVSSQPLSAPSALLDFASPALPRTESAGCAASAVCLAHDGDG
jgi:hypothetical protein